MQNNSWQLQEAKSQFSQLVDNAMHDKPQFVTKHGKSAVVVIAFNEYKNLIKPKTNLITFLQKSPLGEVSLDIERSKDLPRDIEL